MTGLDYKKIYDSEDFKETYLHEREDFGAMYSKEETVFRVWAPFAEQVEICLYHTGTEEEEGAGFIEKRFMIQIEKGLWQCTVPGDWDGTYYTYRVEKEGRVTECIDPYAKACGANGQRGMVVNLKTTNPSGWDKDANWRQMCPDTVIYELHVKDFSYHKDSGVKPEYRGKYLAFTQKGTKGAKKQKRIGRGSTGLDYLKSLGITHVHLLPAFDYASVDEIGLEEQFNWGYDPMNYNIPEGSYATDARRGEVRIREFKQMVQALHSAGIGVVMDVVYNHTWSAEKSSFQTLAPYYYYRQREDGELSNGSACGNETASERKMFRQYMVQSVLYWAREYHIDGFRFDLMGLHDTQTMNEIRRELDKAFPNKKILVYGEPWIADQSPMEEGFYPAVKKNVEKLDEQIGIFCDDTRDAIKGSVFLEEEPGFVNGKTGMEKAIASSVGAWCDGSEGWKPVAPSQLITYVSAHDNFTLWDKLVLTSDKKAEFREKREDILAMNRMCAGIVFTCMGTPFFQAGEEFARTKNGDENSYQSSPEINCLDWARKEEYEELVDYYRGLIGLRSQIAFYKDKSIQAVKRLHFIKMEKQVVEFTIDNGYGNGELWDMLYIVYNANGENYLTELPEGQWQTLADGEGADKWKRGFFKKAEPSVSGKVTITPKSIAVFGKKV